MVRAYQKGETKNPPEKIKEVAEHISPTDTKHFAETNPKGLPEQVKKANIMNEHFVNGFIKRASEYGLSKGQAIDVIKKTALFTPEGGLGTLDDSALSRFIQDLAGKHPMLTHPALLGSAVGGAAGAGIGALSGEEGKKGKGALLGGLTGAGIGAGVGGLATTAGRNVHKGIFDRSLEGSKEMLMDQANGPLSPDMMARLSALSEAGHGIIDRQPGLLAMLHNFSRNK